MVVPQLQYTPDNSPKGWVPQPPVHFLTQDYPGAKLLDVLDGESEGLNDRDNPLFILDSRGITIRIHVGFYGHLVANNNSPYL